MRAHHIGASEEPVPAPRARRTLAGLIDVAIIGLLSALHLRILAVALLGLATEAGRRRLMPSPALIPDPEPEEFMQEVKAIRERYGDDSQRLAEATNRHNEQRRIGANRRRWLFAIAGPAVINSRLRRRLAPTVVVLARPRAPHRP